MLTYEGSPIFRQMADSAVKAEAATKFPTAVMLAFWACESGWGERVTGDFNYYGITCSPESGAAKLCQTHEDIKPSQLATFRADERATAVQSKDLGGGRWRYLMKRWFASYPDLDTSVLAFVDFFRLSPTRYKPAWDKFLTDGDDESLCEGICKAGYATDAAALSLRLTIMKQSNVTHAVEMATRPASVT